MSLLIKNATIITPEAILEDSWLLCDNSKIIEIGSGDTPVVDTVIDAKGQTLLPGFIDIHVHGAVGCDVMDADSSALYKMSAFFAEHGVTSFLPTTLTASHEQLMVALTAIKQAMRGDYAGAKIVGAHLEGPYLNAAKCGAQDKTYIRRANKEETDELLNLAVIRLFSLAPEYDENQYLIADAIGHDITVSAAHTNATFEQMEHGIDAGIRHATHTFNAMPSLHHREPGGMASLLLNDDVKCELIADNIHVSPPMIKLLHRIKGNNKLILITDAMRAAGMPEGKYSLGHHDVTVQDGRATLADGTLAGSILTMDVALRNFIDATGEKLGTIWQVSSYNAAQAIGLINKGTIQIGFDADLVLLDDTLQVQATIVEGQIMYQLE